VGFEQELRTDRPDELLSQDLRSDGFSTIANYGPFQSPGQGCELFGLPPLGRCHDWETLIRRKLLSLYGVKKYIWLRRWHFPSDMSVSFRMIDEKKAPSIWQVGGQARRTFWATVGRPEQNNWGPSDSVLWPSAGPRADDTRLFSRRPLHVFARRRHGRCWTLINKGLQLSGFRISLDAPARMGERPVSLRAEMSSTKDIINLVLTSRVSSKSGCNGGTLKRSFSSVSDPLDQIGTRKESWRNMVNFTFRLVDTQRSGQSRYEMFILAQSWEQV